MVFTYKAYVQLIPKRYPSSYTIAKKEGGGGQFDSWEQPKSSCLFLLNDVNH